jgi:hypothetical protein
MIDCFKSETSLKTQPFGWLFDSDRRPVLTPAYDWLVATDRRQVSKL